MTNLLTKLAIGIVTLTLAGAVSAIERQQQQQQQEPGMQQQQQQEPGMQQQERGMQQQEPGIAQPDPDRPTFSDQQIEYFVDAYLDIINIQEEYTGQVQATEDPEEARTLQEEANNEMIEAIEDNGLSVPEYSEIANAMDMNPELRDQVASMIHEQRQ